MVFAYVLHVEWFMWYKNWKEWLSITICRVFSTNGWQKGIECTYYFDIYIYIHTRFILLQYVLRCYE